MCAFSGSGTGFIVWTQDKSGGTLQQPAALRVRRRRRRHSAGRGESDPSEQVGTILTPISCSSASEVSERRSASTSTEEIGLGAVTAGFGVGTRPTTDRAQRSRWAISPAADSPASRRSSRWRGVLRRSPRRRCAPTTRSGSASPCPAKRTTGPRRRRSARRGRIPDRERRTSRAPERRRSRRGPRSLARGKRTFNAWGDSITQGSGPVRSQRATPGAVGSSTSCKARARHHVGRRSFPTSPVTPTTTTGTTGAVESRSLLGSARSRPTSQRGRESRRERHQLRHERLHGLVADRVAVRDGSQTAVTTHQTARPGAPVLITCPMPVGSSIGTAPQRAQLASFRSSWATTLATIKAACTNGAVEGSTRTRDQQPGRHVPALRRRAPDADDLRRARRSHVPAMLTLAV